MMIRKALVSVAALAAGFLLASPASATLTFNLTAANVGSVTGPFAQVDVTRVDDTHADITFTSLTNGGLIYLMGGQGAVGVNVNATSWTLGTISGSNAGVGFTPGPWSDGGAGNEDGFGSFNQRIDSFDGFTHSSDTISFSLTNDSGIWATDASVLTANANGALAAAHIFPTDSPADAANAVTGVTFFASGSGGPNPPFITTPEPASLALLGLGLVGLGLIRRKRAA